MVLDRLSKIPGDGAANLLRRTDGPNGPEGPEAFKSVHFTG